MIYACMIICEFLFIIWSLPFIKIYQLSGYNVKKFLNDILSIKIFFNDKNKIIFTKRLIRFLILHSLLSFFLFFLVFYYCDFWFLKIFDSLIIFIFIALLISIVHFILLPFEEIIKLFYIKKSKNRLKKLKITKIAITGSYGKTSTKNILAEILSKEYKVCVTPFNYNTPMGITKTILKKLNDHDIFIAEMGARHNGDIKKLCKIISPDYAVLTTIGKQHIETFKSLENIEKTKYALIESLSKDGVAFFNCDNPSGIKLSKKFYGDKYTTCVPGAFAYAKNIDVSCLGSSFILVLDEKEIPVQTKLLGKCNIDNIVTASAVAYKLGITISDIASAIKSLSTIPHRLEILQNSYATIIDDSYNSNIVGCMEACSVLSKFNGRKIVVTPGLVEMGSESSMMNFKVGTMIADVADEIIIMNKINKNYLFSGAISHNFPKKHIYFANSRKEQEEILKLLVTKDSVVLFENDLPDNYK